MPTGHLSEGQQIQAEAVVLRNGGERVLNTELIGTYIELQKHADWHLVRRDRECSRSHHYPRHLSTTLPSVSLPKPYFNKHRPRAVQTSWEWSQQWLRRFSEMKLKQRSNWSRVLCWRQWVGRVSDRGRQRAFQIIYREMKSVTCHWSTTRLLIRWAAQWTYRPIRRNGGVWQPIFFHNIDMLRLLPLLVFRSGIP